MPLGAVSARERIEPSLVVDGPGLLERLAAALESEGVSYCQWKGHSTAHRWMAGQGDIDLLVAQAARSDFRRIVGELGFKPALPPGERQVPGATTSVVHGMGLTLAAHATAVLSTDVSE